MRSVDLTDPNPPKGRQPEKVLLLIATAQGETWGELEPLRESSWAHGVEVISSESISNALHGHVMPLLRELSWDPAPSAGKVTEEEGACSLREGCMTWNPGLCRPGGKDKREVGPPACYEPPLAPGTDPKVVELFRQVAQAWREGRHVVVIRGEGFSLL